MSEICRTSDRPSPSADYNPVGTILRWDLQAIEKKWCAQGDDFRTFLGNFVADLTRREWSPDLTL
jgi:hypothetical protein